jgi:uncharacterized protein (DUF111 family)
MEDLQEKVVGQAMEEVLGNKIEDLFKEAMEGSENLPKILMIYLICLVLPAITMIKMEI